MIEKPWEVVSNECERMIVPGGWLYRVATVRSNAIEQLRRETQENMAVVFVSEPEVVSQAKRKQLALVTLQRDAFIKLAAKRWRVIVALRAGR